MRGGLRALALAGAVAALTGPASVMAATTATTGTATTTKSTPTTSTPTKPTTTPKPSASAGTDWELKGAGIARASFAAITTSVKKKKTVKIEDLTVQASISCQNDSEPADPVDTQVVTATIPVTGTAFKSGAITNGTGTVVSGKLTGRTVTLTYHHEASTPNQFDGTTEVCDTGTIQLKGAPGKRPAVKAGQWSGQTAKQEPVAVEVVAGGRALQAPPHPPANGAPQAAIAFGQFTQSCGSSGDCSPSSTDVCAYESTSTLFVASNGTFGNAADAEGDEAAFAGTFAAGNKLTGTFMNGGEGCQQTTWSATPGA